MLYKFTNMGGTLGLCPVCKKIGILVELEKNDKISFYKK